MASAAKRQKIKPLLAGEILDQDPRELDDAVPRAFLKWCKDLGFDVNQKVKVSKQGSCSHYGMIADEVIDEGETLFTVPRAALLHPGTCSISSILMEGEDELRSVSGWVPLLLCLMHEYTKTESRWRTYLDICPDYSQLDPPMFWQSETVTKELQGTGVPELVGKDDENIRHEYNSLAIPFMKKNPEQFDLSIHTLELYRKMVAFVMAYSFTEPNKSTKKPQDDEDDEDADEEEEEEDGSPPSMPMMVPMADILNHIAKHNARLQFGETSLSMVSTRKIQKGEEVFNTYGELANWQLLQMYGFAEPYPENIYDTVDLSVTFLKDQSDVSSAISKLDFIIENVEMYSDIIVIGCDGVMNKWETCNTLKVLSMSTEEFEEHEEALESDDEDDHDEETFEEFLSFDGFHKMPVHWKVLLNHCATSHLKLYKNSLEQDLQLLEAEEHSKAINSRERNALYVRVGQKKILEKVIQLTRT